MNRLGMNGQWIGDIAGDATGKIIVNVDKRGSTYEGLAHIHDDDPDMPISVALSKRKILATRSRSVRLSIQFILVQSRSLTGMH